MRVEKAVVGRQASSRYHGRLRWRTGQRAQSRCEGGEGEVQAAAGRAPDAEAHLRRFPDQAVFGPGLWPYELDEGHLLW